MNTRLYLVRHGEAASSFMDAADPGLSDLGQRQAIVAAQALDDVGPLPIISSPLARAFETAKPTAALWGAEIEIVDGVAEIPSTGIAIADRQAWLMKIMGGQWADTNDALIRWRDNLVSYLLSLSTSSVIFTHFVAINAAVGAATASDDVLCFQPANCSITVLEIDDNTVRLITRGDEAQTKIG